MLDINNMKIKLLNLKQTTSNAILNIENIKFGFIFKRYKVK
jgi:hypothetical protein